MHRFGNALTFVGAVVLFVAMVAGVLIGHVNIVLYGVAAFLVSVIAGGMMNEPR